LYQDRQEDANLIFRSCLTANLTAIDAFRISGFDVCRVFL
jgi:hypothetical protein